jgi:RNA polymerase sigma-70 factor, ECF subfamily
MSYLRETDFPRTLPTSAFVQEIFGFIPNVFRAQGLLSRIPEAMSGLASAIISREQALTRVNKETVMLVVACAYRNAYCAAWHCHSLRALGMPDSQLDQIIVDYHRAGISSSDTALLDFVRKLATRAPWVSARDIAVVRDHEFADEAILEAILVTALSNLFCTLAAGLGPLPDFDPPVIPATTITSVPDASAFVGGTSGPYLSSVERWTEAFPPILQKRFGYIPNIFRAQTLRPDLIQAEVDAFSKVLQPEDALSHVQKECILLVGSAANLNTYCVAAHCEMLRHIGNLPMEESDQIAVDHHQANLSQADKTLLDFALKLTARPSEIGRDDIDSLRRVDFTEEQILEATAVTALNNFFNTLQMGLGTTPDTEPVRIFGPEDVHPSARLNRLFEGEAVDPDYDLVVRVQDGDLDAFEELISRHSRRIYRTLLAIVGNIEDAEDAMQDTFLKSFRHIGTFQRCSKFSTWLTRIATNTAVQRLRERGRFENIDDGPDVDEDFRPRQIQAWEDNPEVLYSQVETRGLVERELMKLPIKFRVVLVLRDIEQLSGEEAAAALGLGIPAMKARLFRGRMKLREALSSQFSVGTKRMTL